MCWKNASIAIIMLFTNRILSCVPMLRKKPPTFDVFEKFRIFHSWISCTIKKNSSSSAIKKAFKSGVYPKIFYSLFWHSPSSHPIQHTRRINLTSKKRKKTESFFSKHLLTPKYRLLNCFFWIFYNLFWLQRLIMKFVLF